jgi:hypothetical protein
MNRKLIHHRRQSRTGSSLLEVVVATVLGSMLLIPMVKTLVECSQWSRRMELQSELLTLVESCADETKFGLANTFAPGLSVGSFAAQGYSDVRYQVTALVPAEADLRGKYLDIRILVWADLDSDGVYDSGQEPKQDLVTGLAKP